MSGTRWALPLACLLACLVWLGPGSVRGQGPGPQATDIEFDGSTGPPGPVPGVPFGFSGELRFDIPAEDGFRPGGGPNLFHSFGSFDVRTGDLAAFRPYLSDPGNTVNPLDTVIARVTSGSRSQIYGTLQSAIPGADLYFINPAGVVFGQTAEINTGGDLWVGSADQMLFGGADVPVDMGSATPVSQLAIQPPSSFGFFAGAQGTLEVDGATLRSFGTGKRIGFVGGDVHFRGGSSGFVSSRNGELLVASVDSSGRVRLDGSDPIEFVQVTRGGRILLLDQAILSSSGISPDLKFRASGAGDIWILGGRLEITDSDIRAFTAGTADGGDITLSLDGELRIVKNTSGQAVGIFARKISDPLLPPGAGDAGDVRVDAGSMILLGGARISSTTVDAGDGGTVDVDVREAIRISGRSAGDPNERSGIYITAEADGNAGSIELDATTLEMDDFGVLVGQTGSSGTGGSMTLDVGRLLLRGNARIDGSTRGSGAGGDLDVTATQSIRISGRASDDEFSGITSNAQPGSTGAAGTIRIDTPVLIISDGGEIGTPALGSGTGGSILIETTLLDMSGGARISARSQGIGDAGDIDVSARDRIELSHSRIETEADAQANANAGGGDVSLEASDRIYLYESEVTASVGAGVGGNIDMDPRFIVLNRSRVVAQATGVSGQGGNIDLAAQYFLPSSDSLVDASAQRGINGTVVIRSPSIDLTDALSELPANFLDASSLLESACARRDGQRGGSFVVRGREGTPASPEHLRNARYRLPEAPPRPAAVRGDHAGTIAWGRAALAGADPAERSAIRLELAQAYEARGGLAEALAQLESALAESGVPKRSRAVALALRGRVRAGGGALDAGLPDFDAAVDQAGNDPELLTGIWLDRGAALYAQGRTREANDAWDEAERAVARVRGEPGGGASPELADLRAALLADRAAALLEAGEVTRADDAASRSESLAGAAPRSSRTTATLLHLGRRRAALARASEPEDEAQRLQAGSLYTRAARLAEELDDARSLSFAWGWLGGLYEAAERYDEALELTRRALIEAQRAEAPESLYRWQWQAGRVRAAQGRLDPAIDAYRASVRTLLALRLSAVVRNARPGSYTSEFRVEPVITELVDLLLQRAGTTEEPAARARLLLEARNLLEERTASELQDYFEDECLAAERHVAPESIAGAVVIYPVLLPDRTELLVSRPQGIESVVVPVTAAELTETAREFRRELQVRGTNRYRLPAQQLYEWLVRPIEPLLSSDSVLVFVNQGPLRSVPLAALYDERTDGFLVERFPVATAIGLSLTDPEHIDQRNVRLLKAGITQGVQGFPPLQYVGDEIDAIDSLFAGPTLMDESFVRDQLAQELRDHEFGIVHIASHAEFGGDLDSTFLLTYDEKMDVRQLAELVSSTRYRDAPLELLALSACQTAVGDDRAGLGLAGVAVKAGARSTLATLWYIDDAAASQLVSDFYDNLDQDMSRAVALQRAQLTLLRDRGLRHPAYWSPFVLIGSWL